MLSLGRNAEKGEEKPEASRDQNKRNYLIPMKDKGEYRKTQEETRNLPPAQRGEMDHRKSPNQKKKCIKGKIRDWTVGIALGVQQKKDAPASSGGKLPRKTATETKCHPHSRAEKN